MNPMDEIKFGDVVESTFVLSQRQLETRQAGFSPISYQGVPITYHAGDVVNLPYEATERSTIEAVGLAWAAYAQGIVPED
jgi:hypothetical protein